MQYLIIECDGRPRQVDELCYEDLVALEAGDISIFRFQNGQFEEPIVANLESDEDSTAHSWTIFDWTPVPND